MFKDLTNIINDNNLLEESKAKLSKETISFYKNHFLFSDIKLTDTEIKQNLMTLKTIVDEYELCSKDKSDKCINSSWYHLTIERVNNHLYFYAKPCDKFIKYSADNNYKNNFLYNYYANSNIADIAFSKEYFGSKATKSKNEILIFLRKLIENNEIKSSYIYGSYGVGKTYVSLAFANEITKKLNKTVCFVYLPDFINLIMQGFNNPIERQKALDIFNNMKICDVLFIDDLGAEFCKEWFYSGYLLNILNLRSSENKPIVFNSNVSIIEYKKMLMDRLKGSNSVDLVNRIIDRINMLVQNNEFCFKGENMRNINNKNIAQKN